MSEYREISGSLQGERCEHKNWTDLCDRCEIDRLRAQNAELVEALRQCVGLLEQLGYTPAAKFARAAIAKTEGEDNG